MSRSHNFSTTGPGADQVRGHLALPTTAGPWPGVVVLHEALGLTPDMTRQADRFAEHGYLALAPDLFARGFGPVCLVSTMRQLLSGRDGQAMRDIETARSALQARPDCTGKVGVIGFCMGGGFAILAAGRGFDAAAPNYGPAPKDLRATLEGACPMVASYGAKDRQLRGVPERLESTLTELGIDHDVKTYPEAGHSFMTEGTGRWAWTEHVPGVRLVPDAADDAWERVFAFFDRHLVAGGTPGEAADGPS
jgi:carboxymethylenebutenolidase